MAGHAHRYAEIDFLRGIACLAVVFFHYCSRGPQAGLMSQALNPALDAITRYGYLGVDLFFVISGFVILMSAQNATPREFLASRAARLLPAFWVAASLTAGTAWLLDDRRFAVSLPTYLVNLSMLPHWFRVPYVDGAYWSLAVELHFYIMVWVLIRLRGLPRLEWVMLVWLSISFINALRPTHALEFWFDARWAPSFVAGGLFFLLRTSGFSAFRIGLLIASYALAIHYALDYARNTVSRTVGFVDPLFVAGSVTAIFIVFSLIAGDRWRMNASRLTATLGAMTYPVYVIHQNFGFMVYERLRATINSPSCALILTATLVAVLGTVIHRRVERPAGPKLRRWIEGQTAKVQAAPVE